MRHGSVNVVNSELDSGSEGVLDVRDVAVRTCKMPFRADMTNETSSVAITPNVTSLRQQYDEVLRLQSDIACFNEHS